jgi:hypothetical protein
MIVWVRRLVFQLEHKKVYISSFMTFIKSFINSPLASFLYKLYQLYYLLDRFDDSSNPKYLMFFSMAQRYKKTISVN